MKDMVIFFLCFVLYAFNEILFKTISTQYKWFFTGYFNDLIASVLLISYSNILFVIFLRKLYLNFIALSIFVLLVGCYWEYVTPYYKVSTPDPYDILMYYIGLLVYWTIRKILRA
jgi:hypothetical protein